jgi:hypothetical protein
MAIFRILDSKDAIPDATTLRSLASLFSVIPAKAGIVIDPVRDGRLDPRHDQQAQWCALYRRDCRLIEKANPEWGDLLEHIT